MGFPGSSDGKASACNAGDLGSIPGSERSSGKRKWKMETHSSTLTWKIPWMEEPGRLQLDTMWCICPTTEQDSTAQGHHCKDT